MRVIKSIIIIGISTLLFACGTKAQKIFTNPILPGSHPDPSICRVGDNYYLVNSSFIWYPGVPIHRSKDLVNWELIGYALNTPQHLDVNDKTGQHGGIWAPTIRYDKGLFYITVTQKQCGTSIVTTAKDPAGPWSEPVTLHSQNGIDGSILFDGDKSWYTWSEDHLILLREFDKKNLQLFGDTVLLLNEQMFGNDYTAIEGPHIYKLDNGEYMLLIASGGTGGNNHNVSVFKSDLPTGPYLPCPNNPVLTHQGTNSPFNNIGHADIVETQKGEWYAVMLGVRPLEGLTIMDRETFMVKFVWKNGWPVFSPEGGGMVPENDKRPNLPWSPVPKTSDLDDFSFDKLGLQYNFYHTPYTKWWSLIENPGTLRIYLQKPEMNKQTNFPVIARRITQFYFNASTKMNFEPNPGEAAGLIVMINQKGQMRLEVVTNSKGRFARLVTYKEPRKEPFEVTVSDSLKLDNGPVELVVEARGLEYKFYVRNSGREKVQVGHTVSGNIISRQLIGSYCGSYVGIFATSNENESANFADFDNFSYISKMKEAYK